MEGENIVTRAYLNDLAEDLEGCLNLVTTISSQDPINDITELKQIAKKLMKKL